jgi:hypothetical protein
VRSFDKKFEDRIGDHVRIAVTSGLTTVKEVRRFVFGRMGIRPTDPAWLDLVLARRYVEYKNNIEYRTKCDEESRLSQRMLEDVMRRRTT